jgi:hypothetical protein
MVEAMDVRRQRLAQWRNAVGALAAAAVSAISGCNAAEPTSRPQTQSLDNVEINGDRLSLPQTQFVTCIPTGQGKYKFSWTGSNMLVPRHPWDEKYSSSVSLSFATDPPIPQALDVQLYWHHRQLDLEWRNTDDAEGERPSLDSSDLRRFTLLDTLMSSTTPSPLYYVRIEFHC